jgi:hypothetical protein
VHSLVGAGKVAYYTTVVASVCAVACPLCHVSGARHSKVAPGKTARSGQSNAPGAELAQVAGLPALLRRANW